LSRRGVVTACFVGCRWLLQHQPLGGAAIVGFIRGLTGTLILRRRRTLPNYRFQSWVRFRTDA
jgi:hypothetical protein